MPTENKWLPESKAKSARIILKTTEGANDNQHSSSMQEQEALLQQTPEIETGCEYEPSLLHPSGRGQPWKSWNFCTKIYLCFYLYDPEFHNLEGKLGGNPQVLLGFMSKPCEATNSEEFWSKTMELRCPLARIV